MTSPTLVKLAGITYRQLDWWVRIGYLKPDREWRGHEYGSGSPRDWSGEECRVARAMGALVKAGLKPDKAHQIARAGKETAVLALLEES